MVFYFATAVSPAAREAMERGLIGQIITPFHGYARDYYWGHNQPPTIRWCADNGCYGKHFNIDKWWSWLQATDPTNCTFATAPDVYGDAQATAAIAAPWLPRIRALGFPVAYVAQDGQEALPLPWGAIDALFIGGTNPFKLGPYVRTLVTEARARGKHVHMGRVSSILRLRYCEAIGVHSADGTHLTFNPTVRLAEVLRWRTEMDTVPALFDLTEEPRP